MKVAALDLGTNTFLCLIAEVDKSKITKVYSDEVEVVRLGEGLSKNNENKQFAATALARADGCLQRFAKQIAHHKPEKILAMATSAARDVKNADELFKLGEKYQIPIEIIPGEKEAQITYQGTAFASEETAPQHQMVIDIGGGSTELIAGYGKEVLYAKSLNIGCVRLAEAFFAEPPPAKEQIFALTKKVQEEIAEYLRQAQIKNEIKKIIAVAGTPTELAKIEIGTFVKEKIDGFKLTQEKLEYWVTQFANRTARQIENDFGVSVGRSDVILVGTIILLETLRALKKNEVEVSTKGVRYGIALEVASR